MSDSNEEQKSRIDREDEISAAAPGNKKKGIDSVEALKTGNQKQKRYFDKPFDEQMYDSHDDIKDHNDIKDENDEKAE